MWHFYLFKKKKKQIDDKFVETSVFLRKVSYLYSTSKVIIWGLLLLVTNACSRLIDDGTYWGTDDGEYHHSNCFWVNEYNIDDSFDTEEEAIEAGYEPCGWCINDSKKKN